MKTTSLFIALSLAILAMPACKDNLITAPEIPTKPVPTARPNTPTDTFISIDSTIANDWKVIITWKSDNADTNREDGFKLSSGNRKFGWMLVATAPAGTEQYIVSLKDAYHTGTALSFLVSAINVVGESNTMISNEIVVK